METFLRDLITQQISNGDDVIALVHSTEKRLFDKVDSDPEKFSVRRCARWFNLAFIPISPLFGWSLWRAMQKFKPQIIHCHMPNISVFWLLVLPRKKTVHITIHWQSDVLPSRYSLILKIFHSIYQIFERLMLSRCNEVLVSSVPYLDSSKTLQDFLPKCRVEPLFIDEKRIPDKYLSAVQPQKVAGEGPRLLCVGRLTYYKSFDTAIKSSALLPNCQLKIIGAGQEHKKLSNLIQSENLTSRVVLLGEVSEEELWRNYAWCDVLCLPSIERTESFGLVILEAAVFGKPSIVADTPGSGMSWIVRQVIPKGLCFRAGDPNDLARQIRANF